MRRAPCNTFGSGLDATFCSDGISIEIGSPKHQIVRPWATNRS